ncbi:MAG: ankyrin repeat domain-containing protein [Candidatus Anstonellales archaeon]
MKKEKDVKLEGKKKGIKKEVKLEERKLTEKEIVMRAVHALNRGEEGNEIYNKLKEINEKNKAKIGEWDARALGWKIVNITTNNKNNALENVVWLIIKGADYEAKDKHDRNALMMAAWNDNIDIARLLLELGCWIDKSDKYGCTPLMWAARSGRRKAVEFLVERGANLFSTNKEWKYAEDLAEDEGIRNFIINKKIEKIEENAKKTGNPRLIEAIKSGDEKLVKMFLEKGDDVDAKDKDGTPALAVAAKMFHMNLVQILLDAGANVNAVDKEGRYADEVAVDPWAKKAIFKRRLKDLLS